MMAPRGPLLAIVAVALAGLLFGFDTAVIAGVTDALTARYALSPDQLGFTVSAALWGTLAGALCGAAVGNRLGARVGLILCGLAYLLSGLGCAVAPGWGALIAFRVLCGLAIGVSSVLAPVYLAEVAPAEKRGRLAGLYQLNIVIGILVAYLSNALIGGLVAGETAWRWKLGIVALPSLFFLLLLFAVPDSPRWLLLKGRRLAASRAFERLGAARDEIGPLIAAAQGPIVAAMGVRQVLRAAPRPVMLAIAIATFNQLTGINAILYYSNSIFAAAGYGALSADLQSVAVGAVNLVFTILALAVIDRLGRKRMLLVGSVGMAAMLIVTALVMAGRLPQAWLLGVLALFMASFAFSQGAVIWVYLSEIFPTRMRVAGQMIGASTHWIMDALVAQAFPIAAAWSRGAPFLFFAAVMVAQFVVVLLAFPETKGATLEEIEARLGLTDA
jgi:sugar porter (SP) family MFS transporter